MFISATTPLPHISHPASPSSHTCREALSAVRDLDERPQDTVQSRSGILHRPHFTPKEYAAVSRLSASRTSTSSIHKVHAVSRPSLPPAKDLSGRADASPSHVDFSSKGQPACIARHSTPAILPNRHTANDSLSLVNGLGLDLGLPNAAVATNDTASTRCTQTEARRPLTTSKQASDALHDIAVNAAPDAVIRLDDDGKTAIAPSHSETLPRGIDTSASLQDHMLGALLQRVDIKGAAKTPRSLTMQCTSEAHLPSGFTCQTLPLPHPEQLAHVGSEAVASSPKGRWNSTAPPFAPHRSWSHNATVEVPSASLNTTPSKVSFVNKDTSSSTINKQTAFAGHGHFSPVSASPHRHQHANQSSPTSLPSATHWLVNSADHHAHWMPSSVAKTASAWMLGQEALQLLPVQIAAPCQTYTTQTYPCLSQAVPVDIPLVGTQDVYTSLLTTDAKRNFSSPPSSSTDSTPSSSNDMFVINSSPPRGVETSTGASSVEMQCKQRKESLYKTELCRGYEEKGHCDYGVKCQFAHGQQELRNIQRHPKWKTELCRTFWRYGTCPYAKRCCFIHEAKEANGAPGLAQADPPAMKAPLFARVRAGNTGSISQSPVTGGSISASQEARYTLVSGADAVQSGDGPATTRASRTRAAFEYDPFLDSVKARSLGPAH